ncbi:NAD(P)-dependent oxidoreductase [Tistrella bauzanensis]
MGASAARALTALGFGVTGWSRSPKAINGITCLSGADGLDRVIATSGCLVNLLPLTDETRGLIDARRLAQMPAGSHLVNVARGGHVIEDDLLAALDSGHLASATLDVTATEPLAPGHRFWHHRGSCSHPMSPPTARPRRWRRSWPTACAAMRAACRRAIPCCVIADTDPSSVACPPARPHRRRRRLQCGIFRRFLARRRHGIALDHPGSQRQTSRRPVGCKQGV